MAVIGGQLAHPAPLQNSYCNGLVQPSLIMNHHVDCQEDIHPILATNISEYKQQSEISSSWSVNFCCTKMLLTRPRQDLWHCEKPKNIKNPFGLL